MKIAVDEARCVAAGQCVLIVFDQRDEGGAVVLHRSPTSRP
jgi:ferredoxin